MPGKVFAQIILDRVRHHLLEHQRPEQSGFPPKRSTIDRILALRVLTERRREFQQWMLTAFVYFIYSDAAVATWLHNFLRAQLCR